MFELVHRLKKKFYFYLKIQGVFLLAKAYHIQLVIEIGYKQGTIVQNLMKKYFAKTALFKDYAHNDRLVTGTL
jgi:methylase of polypeptide subunit release factors